MIYFSFFCVAPYGEFKNGMFFLLSILLILVLSESFDNFSVGKIISIEREIKNKENLFGKMGAQGTTPRRYVDLVGSLADLVTGSGDKGTPFVLIKNYFKNYSE